MEIVTGLKLEFEKGKIPNQIKLPWQIKFSKNEETHISDKITKLLSEEVIEYSEWEKGQYVNTIFTRPKPDGSFRMILNMKPLNKFIEYRRFKMDTLRNALKLVKTNMFMASIDIKDAYFTVKIHNEHQKFLKFRWKGQLYKFVAMPMGYTQAPRKFTKLLKPVFANLRAQGHLVMGYIDDILVLGETREECQRAVTDTAMLLESCGFMIHREKSSMCPSQEIVFLGFIVNSKAMTVQPTTTKAQKFKNECIQFQGQTQAPIRELAQIVGKLVSCFDGVQYGPLHYRVLERAKIQALRQSAGNYEAVVKISQPMRSELQWWIDNIEQSYNVICRPIPDSVIFTDSTQLAWGAVCEGARTGASFSHREKQLCQGNINACEILAIKLALQAFEHRIKNSTVQIRCDNTTAVAYIKHMGGTRSEICNQLAQEIWAWCIDRGIWVDTEHIPGVLNHIADFESRHPNDRTEWAIGHATFRKITEIFGVPQIDLFASHSNFKVAQYCSWRPEPGAITVNAFSIAWNANFCYCFPPFSLIAQCLRKFQMEEATGIMIVPQWATQTWFPLLTRMLIQAPVKLPIHPHLLQLPHDPQRIHPLYPKLQLWACKISGKNAETEAFQRQLPRLSWPRGGGEPRDNMTHMLRNGKYFVVKNRLITCLQL